MDMLLTTGDTFQTLIFVLFPQILNIYGTESSTIILLLQYHCRYYYSIYYPLSFILTGSLLLGR